jgi:LuxR family transcriptional regulator, quorum-sensing system regulator CciR
MLSMREVQTFVRDVARAESLDAIGAMLGDTLAEIGFEWFALVHHVNVVAPPLGFVKLTNYPREWLEEFTSYRYYADDPTRVACQMTAQPFLWDRLPSLIRLTKRQQAFMDAARHKGLGGGYTVPIHVPGRVSGSANFATAGAPPAGALPIAHHIAVFAFEAARRLAEEGALADYRPVALTDRQIEVISLVAQGKSNWAAGQILGIGERTVKDHLAEAMLQYGVASRTELVVRTLYDGALSFADVIPVGRQQLN